MNRDILILRESIVKVAQLLAGRGLTVTQRGMQAYVVADPKTHKPVRVNVPYLPDNASQELIFAIQGFLDHEIGHVLETDFSVVADAKGRGLTPRIHGYWNLAEDIFVERAMQKRFPGSTHNLNKLRDFFIEELTIPALKGAETPEQVRGVLMVPLVRAWSGQTAFETFLAPHMTNPDFAPLVKKLLPFKDRFIKIESSQEAMDLAFEIEAALNPPPPPAPPAPTPPEPSKDKGDEEDGSDGDSDKPDEDDAEGSEGSGVAAADDTDDDEVVSEGDDEDDSEDEGDDSDDADAGDGDAGDDAEEDGEDGADGSDGDDVADEADGDDDAGGPADGDDEADEDDGEADGDDDAGSSGDEEGDEAGTSGGSKLSDDEPDTDEEEAGEDDEEGDGEEAETDIEIETGVTMDDSMQNFDQALANVISDQALIDSSTSDYLVYTTDFDMFGRIEVPTSFDAQSKMQAKLDGETQHMVGKMPAESERAITASAFSRT